MMELEKDIHRIDGVIANSYLLVGDDLTLIDAGLPKYAATILQAIEELGFSLQALRRILITHADLDHVGGLSELCARTGAKVYASAAARQRLIAGARPRPIRQGFPPLRALVNLIRKFNRLEPFPATQITLLKPDQVLPVRGGLVVIAAPGHTPGHLAFFERSSLTLFAGDALTCASGHLGISPERVSEDPMAVRQTVQRFIALKPARVYCGHGELPGDQAAEELRALGSATAMG
jgi:glyoxylase-like metal-dependent hydrolase (beta-lactamase superfamily II)